MSGTEKRTEKRVPVVLRIKLRYQDVGTFIDKFAMNLSRGGMFIASRSPKPAGTEIKFELKLANKSTVVAGVGVVRWMREFDPEKPKTLHGMGIEFIELSDESHAVLHQVVEHRHSLGLTDDSSIPRTRSGKRRVARAQAPAPKAKPEPATAAKPEPATAAKPEPAAEAKPEPAADDSDAALEAFLSSGVEDALERARKLARATLADGTGIDDLDELLKVSAKPVAESVDSASSELASMLGGASIVRRRPPVSSAAAAAVAAAAAAEVMPSEDELEADLAQLGEDELEPAEPEEPAENPTYSAPLSAAALSADELLLESEIAQVAPAPGTGAPVRAATIDATLAAIEGDEASVDIDLGDDSVDVDLGDDSDDIDIDI